MRYITPFLLCGLLLACGCGGSFTPQGRLAKATNESLGPMDSGNQRWENSGLWRELGLLTRGPTMLQRTAAGRRGCNRRTSWPPSLSLGR